MRTTTHLSRQTCTAIALTMNLAIAVAAIVLHPKAERDTAAKGRPAVAIVAAFR